MDEQLPTGGGLGFNRPAPRNDEFDLGEIIRLFMRHKMLFFFLVLAAVSTASLEHVSFPSYRVMATISVQSPENSLSQQISARMMGALNGLGGDMPGKEMPEKYYNYLVNYDFYLAAARALYADKELSQLSPEFFLRKNMIESLKHKLRIKILREKDAEDLTQRLSEEHMAQILASWTAVGKSGSDTLSIVVTTTDPVLSMKISNLMAETAARYLTDQDLRELNDGERYLRDQLDEAEKELDKTDNQIVEFKRKNQLVSIDVSQVESQSLVLGLKRQIEDVQITLSENLKLIANLRRSLEEQRKRADDAELEQEFKPKFGLARKISELEHENQYLVARQQTIQRVLDDTLRSNDPHAEQRIFDLRKRMETHYGLYQELKKQLFQLEMERILVKNRVRVREHARESDVIRSLSLQKKIGIAVLIALVIGGFGAYGWEMLVPRVKSRADLDELNTIYLGGIPDLSRIPVLHRNFPNGQDRKSRVEKGGPIMVRFDLDSAASMAFKHVRTRVLHLSERGGGKDQVISVHSAQVGEGKSFISVNLAACIAHLKRKVLLIDCDLRRGTTSDYFLNRGSSGLAEVLAAEEKFGSVVRKNVMPLLDLLPAGRSHAEATELIAGERFSELLNDLRSVYDYIVLDTPPVILVPDSGLIARHSDFAVLLASCNQSTKENLVIAMDTLMQLKQKRIYSILNRIASGGMQDYVYVVPDSILESRISRKGPSAGPGGLNQIPPKT